MNADNFVEVPVLIALGGAFAYYVWCAYQGYSSITWPSISADVLSSELMSSWSRLGPSYDPEIWYRYIIEGVHFTGHRVSFGVSSYGIIGESAAAGLVKKYPTGASTRVHYDERHPRHSVLEPGVRLRVIVRVLFFGALTAWVAHDLWRRLTGA